MQHLERPLEGPGSERRLKALQRRFRAVSERASKRGRWPFPLLVAGVFAAAGLATLLVLRLGS